MRRALAILSLAACTSTSPTPPPPPTDAANDVADAGDEEDCPNDLPPSCPANAPSYAGDVAPLMSRRCAPCHYPGGIEDSVHDFSTYAHVHAQAGAILGQIHACLMPPADAGQPTADERAALQAWLVCGSPNN
jgi:hypothetical protein